MGNIFNPFDAWQMGKDLANGGEGTGEDTVTCPECNRQALESVDLQRKIAECPVCGKIDLRKYQ